MLKKAEEAQQEMEFVTIESLVPSDHLLRKIEATINLDFIRERVKHLYCADNGRPALDPVMLFKLLLIGYLYGIRSERQLMREVQVNAAYRWYLRLKLTDKVPDASTLSQNRRRRFGSTEIYQQIFDQIIELAIGKKLISGAVLYTDSTHLKANANKNKYDLHEVAVKPVEYLKQLDEAVEQDRAAHGKKPLKEKKQTSPSKQIKVSRTDKDSGYMVRDGKPKGFFYLDHRTVDGKHALITDTYPTPANVNDSRPYLRRLDRQRERFGFSVRAVGLDAGYATAAIAQGLETRDIYAVFGYKKINRSEGLFSKRKFLYQPDTDTVLCPGQQQLPYRTTDRQGYRQYQSEAKICRNCPLLKQCTRSQNCTKVITRHVWQDNKDRIDEHRLSRIGKRIYKRRKETVERSFADAKQLHGHRYARMRGLDKVREQCLLAATAQNMKKIAILLSRAGTHLPTDLSRPLLDAYIRHIQLLHLLLFSYPS